MKGKIGLIVGLGAGYVLGTRAGRERYAQIKDAAAKVWELEPVQHQVDKARALAKSTALSVPRALWHGAVKVTDAVVQRGSVGQKLDRVVDAAGESAPEIADATEKTAKAAASRTSAAARKTSTAAKSSASKSSSSGTKSRS